MFRDESVQSHIEACEIIFLDANEEISTDVKNILTLVIEKLKACTSNSAKRSKERCVDEASQLLKRVQTKRLQALEVKYIIPFVRLLITMQLDLLYISTACRKLDQMLQQLSEVNQSVVLEETKACVMALVDGKQILSVKDLQTVCMFLEDSSVGREVCRQACSSLLARVAEVFAVALELEASRSGEWCYLAVKVCLQVFQLLQREVTSLVWEKNRGDGAVLDILKQLMSIILGETSNRDTRLLSGTAVAMLINTAPEAGRDGGLAAWSLLQVISSEPWVLRVGALRAELRPRGSDGVDRLAVTRGLLTCCRKDILTSRLDSGTCLILDGLFPVVSALCEENLDCHYYVFQVFTLWLKCLKDCLEEVWEARGAPLLQEESSLQRRLTQVIWNNAESPLEGVSEFVHSSFRLLLEIYERDCQRFGDAEKRLYLALLQRIASLPWEAKAKYFPLSALLPYVSTRTALEQFPELPCHLLKCLSTNHLSPCASDVYKSLLQQQRRELCGGVGRDAPPSEAELAEEWARRWRPTLLEALTSEVTLLQSSASSCLLPWTLRSFPGAFQALLAPLEPGRPGHLRAWACIMSAQRTASATWPLEGPRASETLHLALGSLDDSVRLAALNLLCCSPKTSQPPTAAELSALRAFIPLNLNSESSPFRQHLQAGVRKFLVRIRDSCLARLKARRGRSQDSTSQGREEDTGLEEGVDFVDWLAQLPWAYLAPGHSYQRKKTVLLLLSVVLETCTDTWSPDKKKGQPPANISDLISFARQRGQWEFFSRPKLLVLIGCLEDSTNEVRELAAGLLLRFFPRPLPPDLGPALLERATQLLRSPRVPDAQTGALLFRVLLQMAEDASVFLRRADPVVCVDLQDGRGEGLLRLLLEELEQHYLTAKSDMLLAAKTRPIHGVLTALQKCLLDSSDTLGSLQKVVLTLPVADSILDLLERTSRLLLGLLYADTTTCVEEKEAPPSFCDMGNAIHSVIAQGGGLGVGEGEGEGEDCVLLSEEHSLVLTSCWVSLKEIGIFLGSFVENAMATPGFVESPLTAEYLTRASAVFKDILLKCRHWGAVEGCCVGFTKFCAALLRNSDPELQEIPARMLKQGLSVLRSPRGTSVTRRAAGLPVLILCVAAAEDASKSRPLLALSVSALLETAGAPMPQSWDQTVDLPQVCAVHTLQALVRGSGLGVAVLQYASSMTILSLQLLSSPCWAMRNAALQLYSTLCSRMLGQRPGGGEGSPQHGMSPQAFFAHYPALQPFLLGELRQAAGGPGATSGGARLILHPSLFPVLSLLGKLQPGVHHEARCLSAFLTPLQQLAASSIHNVRMMAARALVVMTPPAEYASTLLRLVQGLPGPLDSCCHNRLHGQLQQIRTMLGSALNTGSAHLDSGLPELVECFESKLWLVTSIQRCPLIRSSYLRVCALLARFCSASFLDRLQAVILSQPQNPSDLQLQIGSASFDQHAVRFLCEEAVRSGDSRWAGPVWRDLRVQSGDAQLSLVRWAADGRSWRGTGLQQVMERALQENLKAALQEGSVEYRRLYLAALVAVLTPSDPALLRHTPPPLQGDLEECAGLLLGVLEHREGGPELLSQALCALSLLLSHSSSVELSVHWCGLLELYQVPEAPEVLRLACAQALRLAGGPLVIRALRGHSHCAALSPRLLGCALTLLQDEDSRARNESARFVSAVTHARRGGAEEPCFQMQVNQAMRCALDLLLEEFWDSPRTPEALISHLPECDLSALLGDVQQTASACLYEQDEPNVFAEPAVMAERLLPYLLRLADRVPESPSLADRLMRWARENQADVVENVSLCERLQQGEAEGPSWRALAVELRFHRGLCGLFVRAGLLLKLLDTWEELCSLCCPLRLHAELQRVHQLLYCNGVLLPEAIPANIGLQRPV